MEKLRKSYGDEFALNADKICRKILFDDVDVKITLSTPDSFCLPQSSGVCKRCFDSYPLDRDTRELIRRKGYDTKLYEKFFTFSDKLSELPWLFYFGLKPGTYASSDVRESIRVACEKIKKAGELDFARKVVFLEVILLTHNRDRIIREYFPEVEKFNKNYERIEMFREIKKLDIEIRDNKTLTPELHAKVLRIMKEYPLFFSASDEEIFDETMKLIRNIPKR